MPMIAGSYKCKSHNTRYTYEVIWDEQDLTATWRAKIFSGRQLAAASGEAPFVEDGGAAVQRAVEHYIESVSCVARTGPCATNSSQRAL
jgi:hypothetical protein